MLADFAACHKTRTACMSVFYSFACMHVCPKHTHHPHAFACDTYMYDVRVGPVRMHACMHVFERPCILCVCVCIYASGGTTACTRLKFLHASCIAKNGHTVFWD
eukprot:GDKI01044338.1.p2 GENE.GDKI01044338.1~~GDKI01044338.1.p2  ORF type:complete len:104 (-),score=15.76 GDKI01044338.1:18-329(-)